MSAPANTQVLSFEQRLQLVSKEVSKRITQQQPSNSYALQARLWCRWLMQEVA